MSIPRLRTYEINDRGETVICDSLRKRMRIRNQAAGRRGPDPKCNPTKKPTKGRLRHYDEKLHRRLQKAHNNYLMRLWRWFSGS